MSAAVIPFLREALAETCALLAPRCCPCGAEGAWLCPGCRAALAAAPVRVDPACDVLQTLTAARARREGALPAGADHAPLMPVLALGEYEGALQRLVLAWKNGGAAHLTGPFARALVPCARILAAVGGAEDAGAPAAVRLVPVPSRLAARLRRGEDHTLELARALAPLIGTAVLPLRMSAGATQSGAGARARRARSIRVTGARGPAPAGASPPVVIVDDVVTTGSTLRAMHEALTAAGLPVRGAIVIASARIHTPDPPRT